MERNTHREAITEPIEIVWEKIKNFIGVIGRPQRRAVDRAKFEKAG